MSRHGRSPNLGIHRARLISRGPLGEFQASRSPRPSSPRRSVCLASPRPSALLINNRGSCPDVDVITGPFCLLPIRVFFPLVFLSPAAHHPFPPSFLRYRRYTSSAPPTWKLLMKLCAPVAALSLRSAKSHRDAGRSLSLRRMQLAA